MNEKKHEINYGIEWLRILSMYMVADPDYFRGYSEEDCRGRHLRQ